MERFLCPGHELHQRERIHVQIPSQIHLLSNGTGRDSRQLLQLMEDRLPNGGGNILQCHGTGLGKSGFRKRARASPFERRIGHIGVGLNLGVVKGFQIPVERPFIIRRGKGMGMFFECDRDPATRNEEKETGHHGTEGRLEPF